VLSAAEVEQVARWATEDLRPHLTVVLDVEPGRAVAEKLEKDRLESAGDGLHERARQYFLELAAREPDYYLVLDARQTREAITQQVLIRLQPLLSAASGTIEP
jgi:dTMP kinase